MTEFSAYFWVSAKVIEYCSHAYCEGIMSSEPVFFSAPTTWAATQRVLDFLHINAHGSNYFAEAKLFGV